MDVMVNKLQGLCNMIPVCNHNFWIIFFNGYYHLAVCYKGVNFRAIDYHPDL